MLNQSLMQHRKSADNTKTNKVNETFNLKRFSHATNLSGIVSASNIKYKMRQSVTSTGKANKNEIKDLKVALELSQSRIKPNNLQN